MKGGTISSSSEVNQELFVSVSLFRKIQEEVV